MTILFVNPHFKIGGIAASLSNLIGELGKNKDLHIEIISLNPYFDKKFSGLQQNINITSPYVLKLLYINRKEAHIHLNMPQLGSYYLVKIIAILIGINAARRFFIKYIYSLNSFLCFQKTFLM